MKGFLTELYILLLETQHNRHCLSISKHFNVLPWKKDRFSFFLLSYFQGIYALLSSVDNYSALLSCTH